jgi:nucleoside-diphosphate-sugar epimerase
MSSSDMTSEGTAMRIFVTGATGWIGSAVVPELLAAGHQVIGLARSDASAAALAERGVGVQRGSLDDLDSLRAGVAAADGVVHLGYNHDFSRMADAAATDRAAIDALGEALAGSGGPLVFASGMAGMGLDRPATEEDVADPALFPRAASAAAARAYAERGARPVEVRFAPTTHGPGDYGFMAVLVAIAREKGVAAYVGDGVGRWPAVHVLDAARLVRLAVDDAPAGAIVHAVAEEGVPTREIAEAIGRGLDLPVESVPAERAEEHFGWMARFFGADLPASSALTRQRMGWEPEHPGIIADLDAGYYFKQ